MNSTDKICKELFEEALVAYKETHEIIKTISSESLLLCTLEQKYMEEGLCFYMRLFSLAYYRRACKDYIYKVLNAHGRTVFWSDTPWYVDYKGGTRKMMIKAHKERIKLLELILKEFADD